jgi:SAM-dependent methyltransferase
MNSLSAVRTMGCSNKEFSSDALSFYEDYWSQGTEIFPENIEHRRALLRQVFCTVPTNRRIAELGVGGEGGYLYLLRDKNETIGFDASAAAIELCRQRGLDVRLANLDTDGLPLPEGAIDIVFATEVFEHFARPQFVLEEIRRVLAPRGRVLISTPNPMVYHWPRLFYPELFRFDAFRDFLMVNGFKIEKTLGFKRLPCKLLDEVDKPWHWIWSCSKVDMQDAQVLFEQGLHFWNQKDSRGLRKKPIEALEFFHRSCQLKPAEFAFRFYLTRALLFRCINGETDEFRKNYEFLLETIARGTAHGKREALYHIAMLYVEFEMLGSTYMGRSIYDEALCRLEQLPESGPYVEKIKRSRRSQDH